MHISIIQAILIALIGGFCYGGSLLGIYTNRCLVLSFFVGLVLGDVPTGLAMGAIGELAFMGFGVGAGGTVPPNPLGPGIVGTIMAITLKSQGVTPASALALSYPFAVLFQLCQTVIYTACAGTAEAAKNAIAKGHYRRFRLYANTTFWAFFGVGFVIALLSALSMEPLRVFVKMIPASLVSALSVAGGLLPAIGFAMILSVMVKKDLLPYILLGYVCISYLQLPVMGVALVGAIFAMIDYYNRENKSGTPTDQINSIGEGDDQYGI